MYPKITSIAQPRPTLFQSMLTWEWPHFFKRLMLFLLGYSLSMGIGSRVFAQQPDATGLKTVCGYSVETKLYYNVPTSGQTSVTFEVTNTNPGNGSGGTFQDLSHWTLAACFGEEAILAGSGPADKYNNRDDKSCGSLLAALGDQILKFDEGTIGSTTKTYTLILDGTNYSLGTVKALFKYGQTCCVGDIIGVVCTSNCVQPSFTITETDYCAPTAAGKVTVVGTEAGASYQLQKLENESYISIGAPIKAVANGDLVEWTMLGAGSYLVIGSKGENCTKTSDPVLVDEIANPIFTITNTDYCAPNAAGKITVSGSQAGVSYQLQKLGADNNFVNVGMPIVADNDGDDVIFYQLAAGTYQVLGTGVAPTSCATTSTPVTIVEVPNPTFTIKKADYCAPTPAGEITVNGTQAGVSYQLQILGADNNYANEGQPIVAQSDGDLVAFTDLAAGTYQVVGTGAAPTSCATTSQPVTVIENPLPTFNVQNLTNECPAMTVNLANAVTNVDPANATITYMLQGSITPIANVSAVGAGTYIVTVTNSETGCATSLPVVVTIIDCQGCTPGYWKNRKASWSTIRTTNDLLNCINAARTSVGITPLLSGELKDKSFMTTFGLTSDDIAATLGSKYQSVTLIQALGLGDGSGYTQLARAATAAMLNSCALTGTGAYPYSTQSILTNTQNAFKAAALAKTSSEIAAARQAALQLASMYDITNNGVCTLNNSIRSEITQASRNVLELKSPDNTPSVTAGPNPFRNNITFRVNVPKAGYGSLVLYNTVGQKVRVLHQGYLQAGAQTFHYNASGRTTSTLMYVLNVGNQQVTGKLLQAKD